jgi:deazaflavin-dependent oxidoreductase (nitroreductase family)
MFKLIVKVLTPIYIFLYKLSGGKIGGQMGVMPILLLTTTGRKSGKVRTVPVAFMEKDNSYIVIASFSGQPKHPAWYHNIKNNGTATIQIGGSQHKVKAEIADPEKKKVLWEYAQKITPSYQEFQERTSREIPVVILHPVS